MNDNRDAVRAALSAQLDVALTADTDNTPLVELAPERYDSLGVLDCVARLEREFGVSIDLIDDDLVSNFRSVATISALVARKLHDAQVLAQ